MSLPVVGGPGLRGKGSLASTAVVKWPLTQDLDSNAIASLNVFCMVGPGQQGYLQGQ